MPLAPDTWDQALEAHRIYSAIFARTLPPLVLERYLAASGLLDSAVDPSELRLCRQALADCRDLEALEIAARYTGKIPLLSRKFRLMVYLAETIPENQPIFVNVRSSFASGMVASAAGVLWSLVKALKGLWLARRLARA
jgi:hypothetical protein